MIRSAAILLTLLSVPLGMNRPAPVSAAMAINPIQAENRNAGSTGWKLDFPAWKGQIEGYASQPSVVPGGTIAFSVSTSHAQFEAEIYRLGWYGGKGGRLMETIPWMRGHKRATPTPNQKTGVVDPQWPVSFRLTVPTSWTTGIYVVKLISSYVSLESYVPFVLTAPASHSSLLFIHGVFTDEAYNSWGGRSLYTPKPAIEVSFARPFVQSLGAGWLFSWEIHMVRWLERRGYDVSYTTDLDVSTHPEALTHHQGIVIAGRDNFWSRQMRNGIANAVSHGVNLANFAAGTGLWQVRLAPLDGKPEGAIVCYRSGKDPIRKTDPRLTTTEWRLPPVSQPESQITGAMYGGYEGTSSPSAWHIEEPSAWIFAGISPAAKSIPHIVGPEFDVLDKNFFYPRNLAKVGDSRVWDTLTNRFTRTAATLYQAPSKSWVFTAGTEDWSWGLDTSRQSYWLYPPVPRRPNSTAIRVTANILNRFSR